MIISGIQIIKYKSLQEVRLNNLKNIVILTGKNGSGKSNLLEALWLFSKDFAILPLSINTNIPVAVNSHLWTNQDVTDPIIFKVTFRFTPGEIRSILPDKMIKVLNFSRKNIDITIERELDASTPNLIWKTKVVSIFDLIVIEDGEFVIPLDVFKRARAHDAPDIKPEIKIAEPLLFITSEEELEIAKNYLTTVTPEILNTIAGNLTNLCRENIKMVFSARSAPSVNPNYGIRTLNIEQSIYNKILSEGQDLSNKVRAQWRKFIADFEILIPFNQRLNIISGIAVVDEDSITLPVHQIGGGTQTLISLLHELNFEVKPIMFIEEPENHLHPGLQKKFFNYLKSLISPRSREKQIWISTHSPFLLNKSDLMNIWVAKKRGGVTQINNLVDNEDLKNIIVELGVKPSDILFSDAILLVDGVTEEIVLPIWGKKLDIDLGNIGCDIIGIGGDSKGKYHLDMWRTITQDAQIPIFMVLDRHAKNEAKKLIEEGKIDEEHCIITDKHSIEEFYNKEYVIKAIHEEWGIELTKSELKNTKSSTIKETLVSKGMEIDRNWWKPLIGKRVAQMMDADEIPYDYRRIFEKIKITLE